MTVHLVKGDDPILRADALDALVVELLAGDDRTLALEDLAVPGRGGDGEPGGEDARRSVVGAAVNAALSPPFMTAVRVVVLRDAGNLVVGDVPPLVEYLANPLDTTHLVVVLGGGTMPAALAKALRDAGAAEHGGGRTKPEEVLSAALDASGVVLRADAVKAVVGRVGGEVGRIPAIVEVLAVAFAPGTRLSGDDVAPYLGDAGAVPPWELTRAIEEGDVAGALHVLQRLLHGTGPQQPKPMHPLQVLAMLHNQYRRVARLDDPGLRGTEDALAALGGRVKEFQARKWMAQAKALGPDGIREAYAALARADLDLKGARAIPEDVVMEVLVARLANLTSRSGGGAPARGRRR